MALHKLAGETGVLYEDEPIDDELNVEVKRDRGSSSRDHIECRWVWRNIIIFAYLHMAAVYGAYLVVSGQAKLWTNIWGR